MIRAWLLYTAMNAPGDILCGMIAGFVVYYLMRRRA